MQGNEEAEKTIGPRAISGAGSYRWPPVKCPPVVPGSITDKILVLCLMLLPLALMLSHRAVAPLLLIAGLVIGMKPLIWQQGVTRFFMQPRLSDPLAIAGLAFFGFCLWIGVTGIWSPLEDRSRLAINVLLPVLSAGAVIWHIQRSSDDTCRTLAFWFYLSVGVAALLLGIEALTGGALRDLVPPKDESWFRHKDMAALGRGAGGLVLLAIPAFVLLHQRRASVFLPLIFVVLVGIAAFGLGIAANAAGLIAATIAFAAILFRRALGLGVVFVMLMMMGVSPVIGPIIGYFDLTLIADGKLPTSWVQRLYVWQAVSEATPDALPWGAGPDYTRFLARQGELIEISDAFAPLARVPTHPHNIFLQIWLEMGIPGIVLLSLAATAGAKAIVQVATNPSLLAASGALGAAILISFSVEASLWQVWRISILGWAAIGLAIVHVTMTRKLNI